MAEAVYMKPKRKASPPIRLLLFTCPLCDKVEPSTNDAFQLIDLDKKQRCNSCKHHIAVKLWKCSCRCRWHMCKTHMHQANSRQRDILVQPSNGQPPNPAATVGKKRKGSLVTFLPTRICWQRTSKRLGAKRSAMSKTSVVVSFP